MKKQLIQEIFKFGIVGVVNTILSYLIYIILVGISVNYIVAHIIAFIITVFISYILNMKYVFKNNNNSKINTLIRVYLSYGITFILSTILLYIQIRYLKVSEYVAPIINLFITTPTNFILNKFWSFKKRG